MTLFRFISRFFFIIITILWTDCSNTNDFSVFIVIKFPDFVFQIAVYRWFRSISDFLLITCHIIIQFTHTFFWNSYTIDVDRHRVNSLSCFAYASQACAQFKTIVILIALNNSSRKKTLIIKITRKQRTTTLLFSSYSSAFTK